MEKKWIILISSAIAVSFILLMSMLIAVYISSFNSYDFYTKALSYYNGADFYNAKKEFKKVSNLSVLKPAAIFREALCANKVGDAQEELKQYERLSKSFSKSKVAPRALYLQARINYNDKKIKKALSEFKKIIKKYPNTKYALASNYFIASIMSQDEHINAKHERELINYAKKYLLNAQDGLYALATVKILEKYTLSGEEKFLIGQVYLTNKDYKNAEKYLLQTEISRSWPYLVQVYYANKNSSKVREFTELGLSSSPSILTKEQNNATYKAIDLYLRTFTDKTVGLNTLINIGNINPNYDYVMYKNCQSLTGNRKNACYNVLYNMNPKGNFAGESLANIFYHKFLREDYKEAIQLGKTHYENFKTTKSAPKVLYWLAYTYELVKDKTNAKNYYNILMKQYPDTYYAYLAYVNTKNIKYQINNIVPEDIKFPYKDVKDSLLASLLEVEDYSLINTFYEEDDFIKSWILYKSGEYTKSTLLARDAMDKLEEKPSKDDLRWRLVYPVTYYDSVLKNSTSATDKTLMLSIIREESYFNPNAKSSVGARGLMQLMPVTANDIALKTNDMVYGVEDLYNPDKNVKLGIKYFAYIKSLLNGKSQLAVLAYNGGIGSVRKWQQNIPYENFEIFIENVPYEETQTYYKKVYRTYWNYLRIYSGINF